MLREDFTQRGPLWRGNLQGMVCAEKMIVWSDPNGHDYAISFLHEEECIDLLCVLAAQHHRAGAC